MELLNINNKSKAFKISISTMIILAVMIFVLGGKLWFYKIQIEKIPTIEKTVAEHEKCIAMIPDIKKGVDKLIDMHLRDRRDR